MKSDIEIAQEAQMVHIREVAAKLDIPEDAVIAAIFRSDKLIIPRGNTQVLSGDKLLVIAKDRVIHELSTALKLK